jgi:hypothetical protein
MHLETWTWNSHVLVSDYSLRSRGFEGWRANRRIGEGLDRTVAWLDGNVPRDARLFVGPDVTMIYGITGRTPFPNAPFIFHANRLLNGPLYDRFRSEFLRQPPEWIVLHLQEWHEVYDMRASAVFRWLRLDEFISRNYRIAWSYGDFVVLRWQGAA